MSLVSLRFSGSLEGLRAEDRTALLHRGIADDDLVRDTVGAIIDVVRREGDVALRALVREYDGVNLKVLESLPIVVPKRSSASTRSCAERWSTRPATSRRCTARCFPSRATCHQNPALWSLGARSRSIE